MGFQRKQFILIFFSFVEFLWIHLMFLVDQVMNFTIVFGRITFPYFATRWLHMIFGCFSDILETCLECAAQYVWLLAIAFCVRDNEKLAKDNRNKINISAIRKTKHEIIKVMLTGAIVIGQNHIRHLRCNVALQQAGLNVPVEIKNNLMRRLYCIAMAVAHAQMLITATNNRKWNKNSKLPSSIRTRSIYSAGLHW